MKTEAEYCSVIMHALNEAGVGYKIPDPSNQFSATIKRCFDIIGRIGDSPVYLEAKFNKKMMACSMKRVEEHQAFYLDEFSKVKGAKCYLAWGIQVARGDCRSYIFDWSAVSELYKKQFSFHIKHLEKLPYNEIHKSTFQFVNIITKDDIIKACGDIYDKD